MNRFGAKAAVFLIVFNLVASLSIVFPQKSYAEVQGRWIDAAHVEIDGTVYFRTQAASDGIGQDNDSFYVDGRRDGCETEVVIRDRGELAPDSVDSVPTTGEFIERNLSGGTCVESNDTLTLSNPERARISFNWVNSTTIESVWKDWNTNAPFVVINLEGAFELEEGSEDSFVKILNSECGHSLTLLPDSQENTDLASFRARYDTGLLNCAEAGVPELQVRIGNVEARSTTEPGGAGLPGDRSDENGANGCEDTAGATGVEMSWLLCPILRGMDTFIGAIDGYMSNILRVPNEFFTGQAGDNLKGAWRNLRNLAYLILVPVALFMVISTALGFEFFSAYTIKKALPRFVIAVIFIALSFELTRLAIVIVNDFGNGLSGLVYSGFGQDDGITLAELFAPNTGDNLEAGGIVLGGAGLTLLFTGIGLTGAGAAVMGLVFGYALMALVALLIGFLLLVARQMILIFLMILAPLAIISWIFPGNEKLWNIWKNSFTALLLLYPLLAVLIATGKSFAQLINIVAGPSANTAVPEAVGLDGLIYGGMKLIAYIAPYFFIPAAFKYAGGAFSSIAGMVNNKEKGIFDRTKARAKRPWAERRGIDKQLQEKSRIGKYSNRRYEQLANQDSTVPLVGSYRKRVRDSGISSDVARMARAEHGKNQLQQATYALDAGNIDVQGEQFEIRDKKGTVLQANADKRAALIAAAQGQQVYNRGKQIADGDAGAARAAANKLAAQGDISGLRTLQSQIETNTYGGDDNTQLEARQAFTEAIQGNVGSVMSKAGDLVKGRPGAFTSITAEDLAGMHATTVEAAVQYLASDDASDQSRVQFADSIDTLLRDQKRYGTMSGDSRAALRSALDTAAIDPVAGPRLQPAHRSATLRGGGKKAVNLDGTVS